VKEEDDDELSNEDGDTEDSKGEPTKPQVQSMKKPIQVDDEGTP